MVIIVEIENMKNLRQIIISKLCDVSVGIVSREEVSLWAMELINDDDFFVENPHEWEVLTALGGIDLKDGDCYLYNKEDFDEWIKALA